MHDLCLRRAGTRHTSCEPASHAGPTHDQAPPHSYPRRCAMPPTILVVDDDPAIRDVLAHALTDAGYGVEQASDGLMALKQIARQEPDLIVADVRMPHLDGIGLATVLAPHTPPIPIILMSANSLPLGCLLPFIRKPFALE